MSTRLSHSLAPLLLLCFACGPITKADAQQSISELFSGTLADNPGIKSGVLLVHSDRHDIHWKFAGGTVGVEAPQPVHADQAFHSASTGKLFTSVLIQLLERQGRLKLDDSISKHLPGEFYDGLFHKDSEPPSIRQLLNHTSGVADYFADPATNSPGMEELILTQPERRWTPRNLLNFTRDFQQPVGPVGAQFHYSDTGYILLGVLIEQVTGETFHENIERFIFRPLDMRDTAVMFFSQPARPDALPMQHVIFRNTDVTHFESLSVDWAGGGLVTTTEDLLKFQRALVAGDLLGPNALETMDGDAEFHSGIYYGQGMMRVVFGDMLFLMKGTPELRGHSGVLGSFLFYAPELDVHLIGTLNNDAHIETSFELLVRILSTLKRLPPA